jgi:polyhydroxybutyrate depolymerase
MRLMTRLLITCGLLVALGCSSSSKQADTPPPTSASSNPNQAPGARVVNFEIGSQKRTALLVVPKDFSKPVPLVFAFHGHGGNGRNFQRRMGIEKLWPEALVVYPNGIPGHSGLTDPDGTKPGWQTAAGEDGDRDLAFYDTMLKSYEQIFNVDRNRIYVVGHSNGSAFTSLLLNQRGKAIAATANLSGQPGRLLSTDPVRSMFMAMGRRDQLVPFANQQRSVPLAEAKLGVDTANAKTSGDLRQEFAPKNIELATYVYDGGHSPPPQIPPLVVKFFQRHSLADG